MNLVQELYGIQDATGYLAPKDLEMLASRTGLPLCQLEEVASFYPHFRREPPLAVEVRVCQDMACRLRGAAALLHELKELAEQAGTARVAVRRVACMGRCDRPPAVLLNHDLFVGRSVDDIRLVVRQALSGKETPADHDGENPGISPREWLIDDGGRQPPYEAVRRYLAQVDAESMLRELETADLQGMGGAGAPTHRKWRGVRDAKGDAKYVVCNGDESEPATFKDRELLLHKPHLVVEGLVLGALVVGAKQGYVFIRDEYQEQMKAVQHAIEEFDRLGLVPSVRLEVYRSPGGYICGEQTALIEALQGRRAEPRNRPPQIETNGLWDCPTLLNNVETLAWVPAIALRGGTWYRNLGANGWKGRRFFSVSGDVNRPGVYETAVGQTLGELLNACGGMRDGKPLKAVAPSGPSGGFLPARVPCKFLAREFEKRVPERFLRERLGNAAELNILNLELDLQLWRDLGLMLGAGLVLYAEGADLIDQAVRCLEFYRDESCGKCVPCRIGTQKLAGTGAALLKRTYAPEQFRQQEAVIDDLAQTLKMTSICGLGTVAAAPLTSLLRYFHGDVERYLARAATAESGRSA